MKNGLWRTKKSVDKETKFLYKNGYVGWTEKRDNGNGDKTWVIVLLGRDKKSKD